MTKPKTEEELRKRVLEVLRREWESAHPDDDKDYRLVRTGHRCEGYVRPDGCAFGLIGDLGPPELDALAEASRLLRGGIEKQSKIARALKLLRPICPDCHIRGRVVVLGPTRELAPGDSGQYALRVFNNMTGVLFVEPQEHNLINEALAILNSEQP